jgi:acetyl-CoA C-acetyltransferase
MPMPNAYLIEGLRTPVGKANGYYRDIIPEHLFAALLRELRHRHPDWPVDEVLAGVALGTGGNMARYALLEAGFPEELPGTTLDMQCGAGLRTLIAAEAQLKSGLSTAVLAGGMESNSLAPKRQYHPRDFRFVDEATYFTKASFVPSSAGPDELTEAAARAAGQFGLSKADMMAWTIRSHERAGSSREIIETIIHPLNGKTADQAVRPGLSIEQLAATQTSSLIDHTNTAHLHDGAGVYWLGNEAFCEQTGIQPSFRIVASAVAGGPPGLAPLGVIWATEKLLRQTGISVSTIDLFEINESFAVKPLAFLKHWGISPEKVNIFGGNLAYGHPFGASGLLNTLHLTLALKHTGSRLGLVAAGVAGGLGAALLIEQLKP